MKNGKACAFPDCKEQIRCRGLCNTHYQTVYNWITKGDADEADLIKRGLIAPSSRGRNAYVDILVPGSKVKGKLA